MISALSLCLALLAPSAPEAQMVLKTVLPMPAGDTTNLYYQQIDSALENPRKSPKLFGEEKIAWEFPWLIAGCSHVAGGPPDDLKFRVYSQEHLATGDKAPMVTRMLLRLWNLNYRKLQLVHNPNYHRGLVDVFLCFGGKAGGEQFIGVDTYPDPQHPGKTIDAADNCIFIYDMPSFTDPVEMAREVAHEYGHATLPGVGGYQEPENWADGYLGEKLFLRWMRDAMAKGELGPDDAMGATKQGLDKWLTANLDPVEIKAATTEPTNSVMADKSAKGMDSFIGLGLYIADLYPGIVFTRSMNITASDPVNYPDAAVLAAEEPDSIVLKIPPMLSGKTIWIPLGTGKLRGALILKTNKHGWAQIQPGPSTIVVTNSH